MKRLTLTTSAIALSFMIAACTAPEKADEATLDTAESVAVGVAEADHSVEIAEARAFLERAEAELAAQSRIAAQAYWNQATNITPETNAAAAAAGAVSTKLAVSLANESKQFDVSVLPADLARKMTMLRTGITIPARNCTSTSVPPARNRVTPVAEAAMREASSKLAGAW